MRKVIIAASMILCLFGSQSFASSNSSAAEDMASLSKGHLGVELDMMPGGPEQGSMLPFITYETDKVIFSLGGNNYGFNDSFGGKTNFWQGEARASYRFNIAEHSFLDLGVDFSWQWGTQGGSPMGTNYSTGPMIGFSRQFPGTPVFFTAFVVVAQYLRVNAPEAASPSQGSGVAYFNNGGIGIRYMF